MVETMQKTRTRLTKAAQAQATREALLEAGERLFADRGYVATLAEDVVERAGVTRGALHHHFADKRGLFLAVADRISERVLAHVVTVSSKDGLDSRQVLEHGCLAYLDACTDRQMNRILFQDAPSVLTPEELDSLSGSAGSELLAVAVENAVRDGEIDPVPATPLACVLLGALSCAGLEIARAHNPKAARDSYADLLCRLLYGLRPEQKRGTPPSRRRPKATAHRDVSNGRSRQ